MKWFSLVVWDDDDMVVWAVRVVANWAIVVGGVFAVELEEIARVSGMDDDAPVNLYLKIVVVEVVS